MAHMLGLDAKGMDNTIGIVLNLLPTASMKANEEGETIKWLIGGQSSASGVLAAEMAARSVKGMREVVQGWLPVLADKTLPERLTEGIDADGTFEQWELLSGVLTKHYATVGPLTASLDATFDLVAKNDIDAGDIKEIHVDAMRRTAIFNTRHPDTDVAARASLPYCLAVAVCRKDPASLLGPAFRKEWLEDKAIWAAAEKVRITENEEYERRYPAQSLARVTITLNDSRSFTQEDDRSARGRYLNPTDEDIESKFRLIAVPVLGASKAEKVIALVRKLETLRDMSELVEALKA
jgi:2-methylcitrate dehydratase PrpD